MNAPTSLKSRMERELRARGLAWGIALSAVVALPGLGFGLFIDDYVHLLSLEDKVPVTKPPFDLFLFAPGDAEVMAQLAEVIQFPWFVDPEVKIHFFRPLSSALMALDHAVFGTFIPGFHLHSLLWYVAFCAAAALLFRRLLPLSLAVPALILFAVDDTHLIPTYWWSNRNALVSGVPALLALWAHLKWREDGAAWGLPVSVALLAVGFLGSEGALAVTAYLGAYELFGRRDALGRRCAALVPAAAVSLGYLLYYKWAGYGVARSGIYLDPLAEPGAVLAEAPARFVMLLGSAFGNVPVEGGVLNSAFEAYLVAASLAAVVLYAGLLVWAWKGLTPDERHTVRWLGIGTLLSMAPSLATFPAGRLLLVPSLGACVLLAVVLRHAWRRLPAAGYVPRAVVGVLVAVHIAAPIVAWLVVPVVIQAVDNRFRAAVLDAPIEDDENETVYLFLNAPDPMLGVYTPLVREYYGRARPGGWYTLTMAPNAMTVSRPAADRLDITLIDSEIMGSTFEQLFRSRQNPLAMGDRFPLLHFTVTVTEMGVLGPVAMRLDFDAPLEAGLVRLHVWRDGGIAAMDVPPTGAVLELESEPGFLGLRTLFR